MTKCAYCGRPAWYQDRITGEPLCPVHSCLEVRSTRGEIRSGEERRASALQVRPGTPADAPDILRLWDHFWGQDDMDCFGRTYRAAELPALLACDGERVVGVLSYAVEPDWDAFNIVVLNVLPQYQRRGAAGRLMAVLDEKAREMTIGRLVVATSNDNLLALYRYQRWGFQITGIRAGGIAADSPGEPHIGVGGIPVRDEIRLEKRL